MTRQGVVAVAAGLLLTAVLTYPTIEHAGSFTRIDGGADARFSVWNVAWVAHALVDDPRHLFDANIFYPAKGTLAYSEANLVAGAIGAPVYAITRNPIAAHNVAVYVSLVLAFILMWALIRRLTGSAEAGLIAATGFAFCANVPSRTAEIQLLMVFVFPLALVAFHRFADAPSWRRAIVLGLALAIAGLASGYYGMFAGLSVAFASVWFARGQTDWRHYWLGLLLAVAVAGAAVAPALQPYLRLRHEPGARGVLNMDEARVWSADLGAYGRSDTLGASWLQPYVGGEGEVLFPGVVVSLLAICGLAFARSAGAVPRGQRGQTRWTIGGYAVLALLAGWMSFGPAAGLYALVARAVPFMGFLRAPARVGIVVSFALAVLAGFGAASLLRRRRRVWLAPLLVAVTATELWAGAWPLRDIGPIPEVYQRLTELPDGPVIEFHFPYRPGELSPNTRYMFYSMWHWKPLLNGYSDYVPPDYWRIAAPVNGFPSPEAMEILRQRHVRYVVIHWDTYNDPGKRAGFVARFEPLPGFLRMIVKRDDAWLLEIQ